MRSVYSNILVALVALSVPALFVFAQSVGVFPSHASVTRGLVEKTTHDYLRAHPEFVGQMFAVLRANQQQQEQEQNEQNQRMIARANRKELLENPASPVFGNPEGSVTVVEFLDYRCPYCKQIEPGMKLLVKADRDVRIVQKQLPILGPVSVFAARVALVAAALGKHLDFHTAMMARTGNITNQTVLEVAESVGLSSDEIKSRINAAEITDAIRHDILLAQKLGFRATPGFVIGDEVISGAMDMATLLELVDEVRSAAK
jgi:protein-disulfide isomerase